MGTRHHRPEGEPAHPVRTPPLRRRDARRLQPEDLPSEVHPARLLRRQGHQAGNPALLSGSADFTWTDTHVNLNHLFVFDTAYVCRQYEVEFNQLRGGSVGRQAHGEVPETTTSKVCP
jgi:hypothetical protein